MAFTKNSQTIDSKDKEYFEDYARVFVGEYDYIFYISPEGIPIEDNGVRETNEEYRNLIDDTILHLLRTYGHRCKNVIMIKGSTNERIEKIMDSIRK